MLDGFPKIAGLTIFLLFLSAWVASAATLTMNVTATVLSKNQCRFTTKTAILAFGTLSAGVPSPPDVQATASLLIRCVGVDNPATFLISDDDGLFAVGIDSPRMQNAVLPTAYLPYSFSYTPVSASAPTGSDVPVNLSATVRGFDYQNAALGTYFDTITLSILP